MLYDEFDKKVNKASTSFNAPRWRPVGNNAGQDPEGSGSSLEPGCQLVLILMRFSSRYSWRRTSKRKVQWAVFSRGSNILILCFGWLEFQSRFNPFHKYLMWMFGTICVCEFEMLCKKVAPGTPGSYCGPFWPEHLGQTDANIFEMFLNSKCEDPVLRWSTFILPHAVNDGDCFNVDTSKNSE